ncbi:RING-H2 finger protein ATL74 [Ricinus communis]|uniref:RING-H2 finger protein ATL74 n=1 Tax=Ricinus communis TaxID=3988 RepID=UPI00201B10A7|nr:RING-H2 finger protein ATL74 [Ricinus communis]
MHRRLLETELTVPQPSPDGTRTRDSYIIGANFDTNMVIILAALLCALLGALGLNSIVRCALRCSSRFSLETPEQTAARLAAKGLKKRELRQIPVAVYGTEVSIPATECPICLGEFLDGEKVRLLPKCNHGFHVRCIDTWLLSHSSCPNCRLSLLEHIAAANSGAAQEESGRRQGENSPGRQRNVIVVVEGAS